MTQERPGQIAISPSLELAEQVRDGLQGFVATVKHCALYPDNNQIRKDSLNKTFQWLSSFLEAQESLKLFVGLHGLTYLGQVVHQDRQGEQNVIFPLFRDGIQWIEFLEGLTIDETLGFINVLNRYRLVKEEDEDDLVTAMWRADFQGVKYKTANDYWDIDPITEVAALKVVQAQGPGPGQGQGPETQVLGGHAAQPASLGDLLQWIDAQPRAPGHAAAKGRPAGVNVGPDGPKFPERLDPKIWRLTPSDEQALSILVAQNSQMTALDGLIPALTVLRSSKTTASRSPVLAYLAETVRFALAYGELETVLTVIRSITELAKIKAETLGSVTAEFQELLCREDVLDGLAAYRPTKQGLSQADRERTKAFLAFLPSRGGGVEALIKLFPQILDQGIREEILLAVAAKVPQVNPDVAQNVNANFPPETIVRLIDFIHLSEADQSVNFVVGLSRNVNPSVREKAAHALLGPSPERIGHMAHLLIEPDPTVGRQIFALISQKRSLIVEKALLKFLKTSYDFNQPRPREALLNCYRCLGRCAISTQAAEFAGQVLLKKGFRAFWGFGDDISHRVGAAMALQLMPPGLGQDGLLAQAAGSFFRDLRKAYQEASSELGRRF
ncbi:MAG: hypothetical protein LBE01_00675 [Deltaproteobacteria bacterium]|jgi:hypothetical protein|nr:hypothetical protein [Deltaproteobacteria bacterium]